MKSNDKNTYVVIQTPAPAPYQRIVVNLVTKETTGYWEDNVYFPGKPESAGRFDRWPSTETEINRAEAIVWAHSMIGYVPGKSKVINQ